MAGMKKILQYILRGWNDEGGYTHAGLRLLHHSHLSYSGYFIK